MRHGFSLEGVDRQVYAFSADAADAGGRDARCRRATTCASSAPRRRTCRSCGGRSRAGSCAHCLGELYYRLPHPGEALTLGAANLARVGGEAAALPVPRVTVAKLGASPARVTVRLTLENASTEPSDLGQVDSNFVELWALGGAFGDVQQGQFYRYDALRADGRRPAGAHHPLPDRRCACSRRCCRPARTLASGPIVMRTVRGGLTDLQVRATFLAPYGGTAEMKPASWTTAAPAPTPTPTPQPKPARRN